MSISKPNLPNSLTLFRILALPWCGYALFKNGGDDSTWRTIAWFSFFLVGLTDIVDGKLARARKQVTSFGAFLDPVADKLMIASVMIPLSLQNRFPWWVTIAILFREVGITLFRALVISGGVISANRGGKIKTLSQNLGIGWFILPLPAWLDWFKFGWIYASVALTYITGYWYIRAWLAYRQDEVN